MQIRFGGLETADGFRFELTGGRLCLDFVNTLDERPTEAPKERLRSYEDLAAWSEQTGALSRPSARGLRAEAARRPEAAAVVVRRARDLRERLFELFSALADGRTAPGSAFEALNAALPEAFSRLRLRRSGRSFEWDWEQDDTRLDRMLWPVVRSTAELLVSPERDRVRECASETCAWLFLDTSRNRSRRWCDMTVCGNRDKVRRFYERRRPRRR